jgi:hypothetical protein
LVPSRGRGCGHGCDSAVPACMLGVCGRISLRPPAPHPYYVTFRIFEDRLHLKANKGFAAPKQRAKSVKLGHTHTHAHGPAREGGRGGGQANQHPWSTRHTHIRTPYIHKCIRSSPWSKQASRHHAAARIRAMSDCPKWRPRGLVHTTGRAIWYVKPVRASSHTSRGTVALAVAYTFANS